MCETPQINSTLNNEVIKELGLQVTHIRPDPSLAEAASRNITTVVFQPRKDKRHTIRVATAICSTKDTFSRKKGVEIALGRWLRGNKADLPARATPQTDVNLLRSYFV